MRSLKWPKWSWGSNFPSYTLMVGSLNPSGNMASRISWLKGDPIAAVINSLSFSSMETITWRRSLIGISLCPLELASCCLLWAMECWEHSWSHLLFNMSLRSALLPNLLNTFPDSLLLLLWSVYALPVSLWLQQRLVCRSVRLQPSGWHSSTESLQPSGFYPSAAFSQPLGFHPYVASLQPLGFHQSIMFS